VTYRHRCKDILESDVRDIIIETLDADYKKNIESLNNLDVINTAM